MVAIRVRENEPAEVATRRFKRLAEKEGIIMELRRRADGYEKPTSVRKRKAAAAIKRYQKKLMREAPQPRGAHVVAPKRGERGADRERA